MQDTSKSEVILRGMDTTRSEEGSQTRLTADLLVGGDADGEYPQTAVTRMRWACASVTAAFGDSEPERPPAPKLSRRTSRAA